MTEKSLNVLERTLWIAWAVILAAALQIGYWALDRDPPFELIKINSVTIYGDVVKFDMSVRRDLNRGCSVEFGRHFIDSSGYRHDIVVGQIMDAQTLADMDKAMGGKLLLSMDLPPGMARGPAVMTTVLRYSCNPLQNLWPIPVRMSVPFEVPR